VKLDDALLAVTRLAVDTAPLIYLVERHPRHAEIVREIVQRMAAGQLSGVTSVVRLGEVLVQPIRQGNDLLQRRFTNIILHGAGFRTFPISVTVVNLAAQLRATYNIHLLDACQIAVALEQGCEAFLTNDRRLTRVAELRVLVLDDLEL
jgi:predicted nucleic acid-binding protein